MESGLRKGYRGGARRSSNVGVPECGAPGIPAGIPAGQPRDPTEEVGVPGLWAGPVRLQKVLIPDCYTCAWICTSWTCTWGSRKRFSAESYCWRTFSTKGVVVCSTIARDITVYAALHCIDDNRAIHVAIPSHTKGSAVPNDDGSDKKRIPLHTQVSSIDNC